MRRLLDDLRPWRRPYDWYGVLYVLITAWYPLLHPSCFEVVAEPGPLHTPLGHLALHLLLAALIAVVPPLLRRRAAGSGASSACCTFPCCSGRSTTSWRTSG